MVAAFSCHLAAAADHLAAAARHAADAALAAARSNRDHHHHGSDDDDDDDDIECLSSPSSLAMTSSGGDGNAGAGGDNGSSGTGGNGSSSSGAGGNNNGDDSAGDDDDLRDNLEAFLDNVGHVYKWINLLAGTTLPVSIYFVLLEQQRASAAWTWTVLGYDVGFTLGVTFVSMRIFHSACCLCSSLRALLLAVCVFVKIFAVLRLLPATMLTTIGVVISILYRLLFYLVAWNLRLPCRRRRR